MRKNYYFGQLNKGSNFYQNKSLAIGRIFTEEKTELYNVSSTQMNDYLITTIQQIGRTAYRQKKLVDVFLFDKLGTINALTMRLGEFFSVIKKDYINNYYCNKPKEKKIELLIKDFPEIFKGKRAGDKIPKKTFRELCNEKCEIEESNFKKNRDILKQAGIEEADKFHYKFTKDFL